MLFILILNMSKILYILDEGQLLNKKLAFYLFFLFLRLIHLEVIWMFSYILI
jgi:hypothetical protein